MSAALEQASPADLRRPAGLIEASINGLHARRLRLTPSRATAVMWRWALVVEQIWLMRDACSYI